MDISKQQNIDSGDNSDSKSITNHKHTYHKCQTVHINPMNDICLQSCSFVTSSKKRVTENKSKRKRRHSSSSCDQDPDSDFENRSAKRQHKKSSSSYQSDSSDFIQLIRASQANSPNYSSLPDSPNSFQDEHDSVSLTSSSTCSTISCTTEDNSQSVIFDTHPLHFESRIDLSTRCGERTPSQCPLPQNDIQICNSDQKKSFDEDVNEIFCMTPAAESDTTVRQCPLPSLAWANANDVWQLMCKADEEAAELRTPQMLEHHPGLQPRMRAILLDWLIEVCEVYKLHRETYYLAVDYLDRYLSAKTMVQKTHLQLIGITCLFVAAKVEEIYPPKIGEFAYVTDGACQEIDILQYEILLLQALDWDISPITAMNWLGVYMQLNVNNKDSCTLKKNSNVYKLLSSTGIDYAFIFPQFSGMKFVHTSKLLDLCSLDVNFANYPYSILAASAISHTFNRETAVRCSGLDWKNLESCSRWMEPFFEVICAESGNLKLTEHNEQVPTKYGLGHICPNIVTDESHMIQTHNISMSMFDHACSLQERYLLTGAKIKQVASPAIGIICPEGLLTPPASSRKPPDVDEDDIDEDASNNGNKCTNLTITAGKSAADNEHINSQ